MLVRLRRHGLERNAVVVQQGTHLGAGWREVELEELDRGSLQVEIRWQRLRKILALLVGGAALEGRWWFLG